MASKKFNCSATKSAEQNNTPLPDRFLCRECKKFLPPKQFSNNEIKEYRLMLCNSVAVTGITAKIRCRSCTGEQVQELQCSGPCDLWKGLNSFSKSQRRNPEKAWCMTCIQWKEASEPGITPLAAPNSALSPDEERLVAKGEADLTSYSFDSIDEEADSDDEDSVSTLYSRMSTMGSAIGRGVLEDDSGLPASKHAGNETPTSGTRSISYTPTVPTYLSRPLPTSKAFGSEAPTTGVGSIGYTPTVPAYISRLNTKRPTSNILSSVSNPYDTGSESGRTTVLQEDSSEYQKTDAGDGSHIPKSVSGWQKKDGQAYGSGIRYNAWDNAGICHRQVRAVSQSTSAVDSDLVGETLTTRRQTSRAVGGWATLASMRKPPAQFPALSRPVQQQKYDEDEDSPDEM